MITQFLLFLFGLTALQRVYATSSCDTGQICLLSFTLDLELGKMNVIFDGRLDAYDKWDVSKFLLSGSMFGGGDDEVYSLTGGRSDVLKDGSLSITLTSNDKTAIILHPKLGNSVSDTYLNVLSGALISVDTTVAPTATAIQVSSFAQDKKAPVVASAAVDLTQSTIVLEWSESVDTESLKPEKMAVKLINEFVYLTNGSKFLRTNVNTPTLTIKLGTQDRLTLYGKVLEKNASLSESSMFTKAGAITDISGNNNDVNLLSLAALIYKTPRVKSVSPNIGGGDTEVTISGATLLLGFNTLSSVYFGGVESEIKMFNSSMIVCVAPHSLKHIGSSVEIVVELSSSLKYTSPINFTYKRRVTTSTTTSSIQQQQQPLTTTTEKTSISRASFATVNITGTFRTQTTKELRTEPSRTVQTRSTVVTKSVRQTTASPTVTRTPSVTRSISAARNTTTRIVTTVERSTRTADLTFPPLNEIHAKMEPEKAKRTHDELINMLRNFSHDAELWSTNSETVMATMCERYLTNPLLTLASDNGASASLRMTNTDEHFANFVQRGMTLIDKTNNNIERLECNDGGNGDEPTVTMDAAAIVMLPDTDDVKYPDQFYSDANKRPNKTPTVIFPKSVFGELQSTATISIAVYNAKNTTKYSQMYPSSGGKGRVGCPTISINARGVPSTANLDKNITICPPLGSDDCKALDNEVGTPLCGWWSPELQTWETQGCVYADGCCHCNHLTHFGVLFKTKESDTSVISEDDAKSLEIITYVGVGLSLAAMITAVITYIYLRDLIKLRERLLFSLMASIAAAQVIFISGIMRERHETDSSCKAVAILEHYFLLASFAWMTCEGIHLYETFVIIFPTNPTKFWQYNLIGWGAPLIIVVVTLVASYDDYASGEVCFIETGSDAIWAFLAPAIFAFVGNFLCLGWVVRGIAMNASARAGIRSFVVFGTTLGLSYLFGILLVLHPSFLLWHYLFAITVSTQGLCLFFFHCYRRPEIRRRLSSQTRLIVLPRTSSAERKSSAQSGKSSTHTTSSYSEAESSQSHQRPSESSVKTARSSGYITVPANPGVSLVSEMVPNPSMSAAAFTTNPAFVGVE
eukprot:m.29706 g.29706  ORF g.29706 m.29706 type:complete len:1091 (+) comp8128_c0_seq1:122-3394(+)